LHDWSKGYDKSIVAIENGYITGRKTGDCGSNLGLEVIRGKVEDGDRYNYITHTTDGKILKSSTMYIKDESGQPIGALCINTDISSIVNAKSAMEKMLPDEMTDGDSLPEYFASNVSDLLGYLIGESLKMVGRPASQMSKEDKLTALKFLDEKGALLISKSGSKICQSLDISKFTLYNYLEEIRSNEKKSSPTSN